MKFFSVMLVLFMLSFANPATAGQIMVGDDDTLHKIQDIEFKGPKGEKLSLGYRTTITFIGGGIRLKDQGYILLADEVKGQYYPLTNKLTRLLQEDGTLPNPLPKYKIGAFEYIFGYSAWWNSSNCYRLDIFRERQVRN